MSSRILRLHKKFRELRERLPYIDVEMLGDHIAALTLEFLDKTKAKNPDELAHMLQEAATLIRNYFPFSFSSQATADVLSVLASKFKSVQEDPASLLDEAKNALRRLLSYSTLSLKHLPVNLSRVVSPGSEVLVFGYTDSLAKLLLSISGKIKRVNTISYWPLMSGRGFAAKLRKLGIESIPWPDIALPQAVSRSDHVIIAVTGVSGEGALVAEAGAYAAILLASHEDRDVVAVARAWNFRPSLPSGITEVYATLEHPLEKKIQIWVRLFDVVPVSKISAAVSELGIHTRLDAEAVAGVYHTALKSVLRELGEYA